VGSTERGEGRGGEGSLITCLATILNPEARMSFERPASGSESSLCPSLLCAHPNYVHSKLLQVKLQRNSVTEKPRG
jgi:hypothetical protein